MSGNKLFPLIYSTSGINEWKVVFCWWEVVWIMKPSRLKVEQCEGKWNKYYKRSYCKYVLNGVLMIYWCSSQGVHTGFGTNYPKIKLFATDRRASLWKLQSWQPRRRLLWPNFGWWVWASLQQRRFFSATLLRLLVDGLRSAALLEGKAVQNAVSFFILI